MSRMSKSKRIEFNVRWLFHRIVDEGMSDAEMVNSAYLGGLIGADIHRTIADTLVLCSQNRVMTTEDGRKVRFSPRFTEEEAFYCYEAIEE